MTPSATAFRADGFGPGFLCLTSFEGLDDPHVAHSDGDGVLKVFLARPNRRHQPRRLVVAATATSLAANRNEMVLLTDELNALGHGDFY